MLGPDTSIVVVLTRDEVRLLQCVDKLRSHDSRLALELSRKECLIIRELAREESRRESYRTDDDEDLRLMCVDLDIPGLVTDESL
jgi:hypothetical protein